MFVLLDVRVTAYSSELFSDDCVLILLWHIHLVSVLCSRLVFRGVTVKLLSWFSEIGTIGDRGKA